MSAQAFYIATHEFPDPAIDRSARDVTVNASISYKYDSYNNIRTLSTNNAISGSDRIGYLYVPHLDASNDCLKASEPYVPSNVTRFEDLPQSFQVVAIAPWISPACTLSYLTSARADQVVAFIFFLPNSSTDTPPTPNDAAWGLGDGGQWKKNNPFPVYAISAPSAIAILNQSSYYSGTTSSAPYGAELTAIYGKDSFVRLYIDIDLGSRVSGVPSIWIFLLIILAVLLAGVAVISGTMHMIQRRRRVVLQRRVANGEVDLEALGVKRLTVPQSIIDKMPVYPYQQEPSTPALSRPVATKQTPGSHPTQDPVPLFAPLYQPTCAICLDDFVPQETSVRELPCRHIFHPSCCDTFLKENSSLCPLCKRSTLPKGYCPADISNLMVRRERNLRRMRRRSGTNQTPSSAPGPEGEAPVHVGTRNTSTEMATLDVNPRLPPLAPTASRSEWARRRALAMIGPRAAPDEDEDQRQSSSRAMKFLRGLFPTIR